MKVTPATPTPTTSARNASQMSTFGIKSVSIFGKMRIGLKCGSLLGLLSICQIAYLTAQQLSHFQIHAMIATFGEMSTEKQSNKGHVRCQHSKTFNWWIGSAGEWSVGSVVRGFGGFRAN